MAKDALTAHGRDELGISETTTARPVQAALTSAATFSFGAAMPLLMVVVAPAGALVPIVSGASLGFLALLGAIGARAGGADVLRAHFGARWRWLSPPGSGRFSARSFEEETRNADMSRSMKKSPGGAVTTAESDKDDKVRAHRRTRRTARSALQGGAEELPDRKETERVWSY